MFFHRTNKRPHPSSPLPLTKYKLPSRN